MRTIKILMLCMLSTTVFAQQKLNKISKSIKANKGVVIDLNTNYVEIEIETWNKNTVEIEGYIESNKLSKADLQKALKNWNIEVTGSGDNISIKSIGSGGFGLSGSDDYSGLLRDLEIQLADLPEIPEMPEMPEMPTMPNVPQMPNMPAMPVMPDMPEFPELPDGVKSVNFDYEKYKKDGESYLEKWSQEYEDKYGKKYKEKMKDWAREFSESGFEEKMAKWGEKFGERFEGKWAKDMEAWGEKFGESFGKDFEKKMEQWEKDFEKGWGKDFEKKMEAWGERFGAQMEHKSKLVEERSKQLGERAKQLEERNHALLERNKARSENREANMQKRSAWRGSSNVKKVIKIKMPKKAKLKMNVRHGELKISSVIYDLQGQLSYSSLVAQSIDGSKTSINANYSSVLVNDWKNGVLNLKYVTQALLKTAKTLTLNSNSSNINIDNLSGNNIIDGSFGELTIHNISEDFNTLNIILDNSDAWIKLPQTEHSLLFKGERSKFNNKLTKNKVVNSATSSKSIVINAKFSNVVMQ